MTSNASKIAATITPEQVTEGFSSSTTKSTTPPQIQIFNSSLHPEFGNLRTLTIEGEPWFVGKDVAEALGYFNTSKAIRNHVSEDDLKTLKYKAYNVSGEASLWKGNDYSDKSIINESGLYSLILGSKLEKAKEFKHWVTAEVLPTIRKTGGYINPGQEDLFVETYLPFADENVKNFFRLNMQAMAQQNKIIKDQKLQLESQQKDLNEKDNRILAQRQELSKQHEQLEFKDQQIEEYVDVVTDLVKDVPLAGKRAIINRVLRAPGDNFGARYMVLYREFDNIYHINTKFRMNKYNETHSPKCKSRLQYIDEQLGMLNELYELTVKLFKSRVETLVQQMYNVRL